MQRKVTKLENYFGSLVVCLNHETRQAWLELTLEGRPSENTMDIPWEAGVLLMNDASNTSNYQY